MLALDSVRAAWSHESTQEVRFFVEHYLLRMLNSVTQISLSKMGVMEKEYMEEVLSCTLRLVLKFINHFPSLIHCVAKVFDQKISFYAGKSLFIPLCT